MCVVYTGKLRTRLSAPICLYSNNYACTWIDFKLQLLLRAGDIHANPGPCYNGGVNFWQFVRQSGLNQRPSQNGYPVSSRDFPRISDLALVYDRASLLALYHRRQPTADVRSILYSAGLLLRRRRGTKAGRRRIRSATGVRVVTPAVGAAVINHGTAHVDDDWNFHTGQSVSIDGTISQNTTGGRNSGWEFQIPVRITRPVDFCWSAKTTGTASRCITRVVCPVNLGEVDRQSAGIVGGNSLPRFFVVNAQSLAKNNAVQLLRMDLSAFKIDFAAITET